MAINSDDPHLYEHLVLIIDAFEKTAIQSGTRKGAMVAALGPLNGFDLLLDGSSEALAYTAQTARAKVNLKPTASEGQSGGSGASAESPEFSAEFSIGLDDLGDLGVLGDRVFSECFGCDFRLAFDWQLKPVNLLGPIDGLLKQIDASIDGFAAHLDPFKSLEGLCDLLNQLKTICIPDLVLTLVGLKFLLKKYLMNTLDIKLDWTVVLGPLLKLIVEGISSLLNGAAGIIVGPLTCVKSGLGALNQIEKDLRGTVNTLKEIGQGNGSILQSSFTSQINSKSITWTKSDLDQDEFVLDGVLSTRNKNTGDLPFESGGALRAHTSLSQALIDPQFLEATLSEKLLVPIAEVIEYIKDLVKNIEYALKSLNQICAGGLSLNLQNLGVVIFLTDLVSMISTIIKLLNSNPRINDWCDFLETNPQVLEDVLRSRHAGIVVENTTKGTLTLRQGPQIVGKINTCANQRSGVDQQTLNQWMKDLERGI